MPAPKVVRTWVPMGVCLVMWTRPSRARKRSVPFLIFGEDHIAVVEGDRLHDFGQRDELIIGEVPEQTHGPELGRALQEIVLLGAGSRPRGLRGGGRRPR